MSPNPFTSGLGLEFVSTFYTVVNDTRYDCYGHIASSRCLLVIAVNLVVFVLVFMHYGWKESSLSKHFAWFVRLSCRIWELGRHVRNNYLLSNARIGTNHPAHLRDTSSTNE
jgi:hypothetical protein